MINYSPVLHNYGALPQTYEDPEVAQPAADGLFGDADPLDVVDIGAQAATIGEVYEVHLLGALGIIDEGECDWKIIAIRSSDPLAAGLKGATHTIAFCTDQVQTSVTSRRTSSQTFTRGTSCTRRPTGNRATRSSMGARRFRASARSSSWTSATRCGSGCPRHERDCKYTKLNRIPP